MAKKKPEPASAPSIVSKMSPGKGGQRSTKRFIIIYSPGKVGKTAAASKLNAKWIVSDPNALPTLQALGRLPAPSDIYEVTNLAEARAIVAEALKVAEEHGPGALGAEAFVFDSLTQWLDWHQEDIAQQTSQRFLGDNQKNNGWQHFNADFGRFIDDLVRLSQYVHVVGLCHANVKADPGKGQWAGISLNPKMAERVGRSCNWLLYMTSRDLSAGEAKNIGADDAYVSVNEGRIDLNGAPTKRYTERILHTVPVDGGWHASAAGRTLKAEEVPDLVVLLEKEGLL